MLSTSCESYVKNGLRGSNENSKAAKCGHAVSLPVQAGGQAKLLDQIRDLFGQTFYHAYGVRPFIAALPNHQFQSRPDS